MRVRLAIAGAALLMAIAMLLAFAPTARSNAAAGTQEATQTGASTSTASVARTSTWKAKELFWPPSYVKVPSVKSKTVQQAKRLLTKHPRHLKVTVVYKTKKGAKRYGRVHKVSFRSKVYTHKGYRYVAPASRVTLLVYKRPKPRVRWNTAKVSWYGPGFYGNTMAGGGTLRKNSMVVAHRSMQFGTMIQFKYKGRTCVAEVRDRGPFIAGRTFDLGPGTARALDFGGVGTVQWRIVKKP